VSIEARFENQADERGASRRTLHLGVSGKFGTEGSATVQNLSASGLLIETATPLEEGEKIVVDLPHTGERSATVIWSDAPMHGCRFDEPLSSAALSAVRGSSAFAASGGYRWAILPANSASASRPSGRGNMASRARSNGGFPDWPKYSVSPPAASNRQRPVPRKPSSVAGSRSRRLMVSNRAGCGS
jgi:hypothetical protein